MDSVVEYTEEALVHHWIEVVRAHRALAPQGVVVILGPTAVGKSGMAIAVAKELGGEIINGDSRQLYKDMTIGTGAIPLAAQEGVPHHLMEVLSPGEAMTAFGYRDTAQAHIEEIQHRGALPVVVGGSGLYLNTLVYGYQPAEEEGAGLEVLRSQLEEEWEERGAKELYAELQQVDPVTAAKTPIQNKRYVLRALEVYRSMGIPKSQGSRQETPREGWLLLGMERDRGALYQRIDRRHRAMFEEGLVEEVQALLSRGYALEDKGMETIGYREVAGYLTGLYDREECIQLVCQQARKYAKRQLTWFRRMEGVEWAHVVS